MGMKEFEKKKWEGKKKKKNGIGKRKVVERGEKMQEGRGNWKNCGKGKVEGGEKKGCGGLGGHDDEWMKEKKGGGGERKSGSGFGGGEA
jgi:hypothetical protein